MRSSSSSTTRRARARGGTVEAGEPLDRVRDSERVADRGVAGDRLGEEDARDATAAARSASRCPCGRRRGGAADTGPARRPLRTEVPGLDDAGVHRAHGQLEHAFAGHRTKRMELARDPRHLPVVREVLAQGPRPVRPVVVEATRMGLGWPSGTRPKKSITSRSNQFAARVLRGDRRESGMRARSTRRRDAQERPAGAAGTRCGGARSGRSARARRWRRATARRASSRSSARSAIAGSAPRLDVKRQLTGARLVDELSGGPGRAVTVSIAVVHAPLPTTRVAARIERQQRAGQVERRDHRQWPRRRSSCPAPRSSRSGGGTLGGDRAAGPAPVARPGRRSRRRGRRGRRGRPPPRPGAARGNRPSGSSSR